MKKLLLALPLIGICFAVRADDAAFAVQPYNYATAPRPAVVVQGTNTSTEIAARTAVRDQLKADIANIDSETARCKKNKTLWTAITIIGSVGTVATGITAISQANTLSNKNKELKQAQSKLNDIGY